MSFSDLEKELSDNRQKAKFFGGKALKGTRKQVIWAEKIRAEKISKMDEDGIFLSVREDGLGSSAKFWIVVKDKTSSEISSFFKEQTELLQKAKVLKEEYLALLPARGIVKTTDEMREAEHKYNDAVTEYNALTKSFGFE